jgi:hypothetical protein
VAAGVAPSADDDALRAGIRDTRWSPGY